ncbi:MAG: LysR family transcriptional regulator [Nitrospirae bacterium]|nr:LysR family transcriptional regulator [Nitrospirota bacterium]
MEDHRLKAFCLVVEMKSFSKAAEAKFMTQSAMSHLIKNLEDEMGIRLFIRKAKAVILTPAGRILYEHAKKILKQYENMEGEIYAFSKKIKGPLYMGASTIVATYLLPQVFYNFSKNYPEVHIELFVSNTETIINSLFEGKTDIGIVEGQIRNSKVYLEEIAEDEIVIIASDENPLLKKQPLTDQDLVSQPFIMPEVGSGIREFIDDFFIDAKIDTKDIRVAMTLANPELVVQMVQAGIGISFVSKWAVFKAIKDGSVKLLNISDKKLKRKFYLVSMEKEPSTIVGKTFWEFTKGYRFFMPF